MKHAQSIANIEQTSSKSRADIQQASSKTSSRPDGTPPLDQM